MPKDKATPDYVSEGIAETIAEAPVAEAPLTQEQLMAELQSALTKGDFKSVAQISRKIDTLTRATEKAELDAKRAILDSMIEGVKVAITKAIEPIVTSGKLDAADGIWFSYDFGEQAPTVRLMRTAARAARTSTGAAGTGRKFDISTDAMLAKFGADEYKDGMTYQQAYEGNTDKNWRYAIRQKLLKLEGVIS